MKYKDWLDVWFANYIEPSSKTKTCERYSEIIEKHLKVYRRNSKKSPVEIR